MAASASSGAAQRRSQKDKERAAMMKRLGIERTTCRCSVCYHIVSCDGPKSRYTHVCRGY